MIPLTIDGIELTVAPGSTILQAARTIDVEIPTLCHAPGLDHTSACMVCSVQDRRSGNILPACTAVVEAGMEIDSSGEEVTTLRRSAVELLLSEHAGDCEAPCRLACATGMDIPGMLRALARGARQEAQTLLYRHMAMPVTLGHVCDAPCQKACRRAKADGAVEIRDCHRMACDDKDVARPEAAAATGRSVAVVGAGLCGLSAAYFLCRDGHEVTLFEKEATTGGALRRLVDNGSLPKAILDTEIERILAAGVALRTGETVDDARLAQLERDFDATLLACDLASEREVFRSPRRNKPVLAAGEGRKAAEQVSAHLAGRDVPPPRFNARLTALTDEELQAFLEQAPKTAPGLSGPEQLPAAAARCLHCDCRKPDRCKLRQLADTLGARQRRFGTGPRRAVTFQSGQAKLLYEPGKCILCGICTSLAQTEQPGLTLHKRGYELSIAVPFGAPLSLSPATAAKCAEHCPVGALTQKA